MPRESVAGISSVQLAGDDLTEGLKKWRLWGMMGWQDVRQRYHRTTIGPFWLTLSVCIMIGAMGLLNYTLWGVDPRKSLPYITTGVIGWFLISVNVNESCAAFTSAQSVILQVKLPYSVYIYRIIWRNLIVFFHNIVIFVLLSLAFLIVPTWSLLLLPLSLALICVNGIWVGMVLSVVSTRFRDIQQIVASVMFVFFILTPIFWDPAILPQRPVIVDTNPFYHFLELIRAPLLGHAPSALTWAVVLGFTAVGWAAGFAFFQRFRSRIPYWL